MRISRKGRNGHGQHEDSATRRSSCRRGLNQGLGAVSIVFSWGEDGDSALISCAKEEKERAGGGDDCTVGLSSTLNYRILVHGATEGKKKCLMLNVCQMYVKCMSLLPHSTAAKLLMCLVNFTTLNINNLLTLTR